MVVCEPSDDVGREVSKGGPKCVAAFQDRERRQPRLKCFETELFEEFAVTVKRVPPLLVVVTLIF